MTVLADVRRWDYDGNGSTATYPFSRKILAATDLEVTRRVTATGAEVTLTNTVDYNVTGVGNASGGNVVLAGGNLASGLHLTIRILFPLTQETDFANQGGFFPESHEDALDKAAGIDQQQQEHLDRTVRFSPGVDPTGHSFEIPYGSEGKFLAVNANGDIAASVGTGADVGIREDLADDTNGAGNGNNLVAYPITDEEVLAGKTPTAPSHPPGDVRRFGATGDGVTDDTTALQNTLDSGVLTVTVPIGTYVHDPISVPAGVHMILAAGAQLYLADGATASSVTLAGAKAGISGVGTIEGNTANQTNQCDGVRIAADGCFVKDITIQNTYRYGIRGTAVNDCRVDGVYVDSAGDVGIGLIYSGTSPCDRNEVVNCYVLDCGALTTQGGIKLIGNAGTTSPCTNNVIANNRVYGATQISIEVFGNCRACSVTGNTTRGGTMGVSVDGSEGVAVTGNSVWGATTYGIELAGGDRNVVTGNTIECANSTTAGIITAGGGSPNATIAGNAIYDFASKGIQISSGSNGTAISGNTVKNGTGTGTGIYIASNEVTLSGNTVDSNAVGLIGCIVDNQSYVYFTGEHYINAVTNALELIATSGTVNVISVTGGALLDATNRLKLTSAGGSFGSSIITRGVIGLAPVDYLDRANNILNSSGAGTPEGAVTAGVGSEFRRTDGGASTVLYIKESGTGNTGWVPK